jgi:hypothetical protein
MMSVEKYCTAIAMAIALSGCAALQQAPLIYSSKISVGVGVSANTTDTPGLSINIGYKQVDAAYVPVAVAKPCDTPNQGDKTDCTNAIYRLEHIKGENDVVNNELSNASRDAAQKIIDDFLAVRSRLTNSEAEVIKAKGALDRLNNEIRSLEAETKPALAEDANDKVKAERQAKVNRLTNIRDKKLVVSATNAVATADLARTSAENDLRNTNLTKVADAIKAVGGANKKFDAYSVFGSFDANTTTGVTGSTSSTSANANAALSIGRVFSTGVASQNLTEGMRRYYEGLVAGQLASCLNNATKIYENLKGSLTGDALAKEVTRYQELADQCKKDVKTGPTSL